MNVSLKFAHLSAILFTFLSFVFTQHFNLELEETGESTLFIFSTDITSLQQGDEVGLFDSNGVLDNTGATGELLVGAGVWTGSQLEVTAIGAVDLSDFGGPIVPGYNAGNTMTLKIWDDSEGCEYDATYTTSFGSGSFNGLFSNVNSVTTTGDPVCDDDGGGGDGGWDGDACTMPENTLNVSADGVVLYNSSDDIGGFQFDVDGAAVSGASGGDAAAAGFTVSAGGATVLGFSFICRWLCIV